MAAPKPRKERTPDELRRASVHVFHELGMLRGVLPRLDPLPDDYVLRCALLESFLIHARALHHFLWPSEPIRGTDVLAVDYFRGRWANAPAKPETTAMVDFRDHVNWYIAHVTYLRPDGGEEKRWDLAGITSAIGGGVETFRKDVDPVNLDARWRRHHPRRAPLPPLSASTTEGGIVSTSEWFSSEAGPPDRQIEVTNVNAVSSSYAHTLSNPPGSTTDPTAGDGYRHPRDPDDWTP